MTITKIYDTSRMFCVCFFSFFITNTVFAADFWLGPALFGLFGSSATAYMFHERGSRLQERVDTLSSENEHATQRIEDLTEENGELLKVQNRYELLKNHLTIAGLLLEESPRIVLASRDNTLFNRALKQNDPESMRTVFRLSGKNFDINGLDESGTTAFHIATRRKNKEMMRMLCEELHAHPDTPDRQGMTALHYAVLDDDAETIDVLLYLKADPNNKNKEGQTPFMLALSASKACAVACFLSELVNQTAHKGMLKIALTIQSMDNLATNPNIRRLLDSIFQTYTDEYTECPICFERTSIMCFPECCEKMLCDCCSKRILTLTTSPKCPYCQTHLPTSSPFMIYESESVPATPCSSSS